MFSQVQREKERLMSEEAKLRGEAYKKKVRLCWLGGSYSKRWRRSTSTGSREEWDTPGEGGRGISGQAG